MVLVSKKVVYNEPKERGINHYRKELCIEEAIDTQKEVAGRRGCLYNSDDEALDDFLSIHWAWIEENE